MNATIPADVLDIEAAYERARRRTVHLAEWRAPATFRAARFHRHLGGVCDQIVNDALSGVVAPWVTINAPPRHGKSELVGRCMGPRGMMLRPGFSVLYMTSTDERAKEVTSRARGIIERASEFDPHLKPGRVWGANEWETVGGNTWVGVGVGASTGGIGANLIILDDVTGNGERAASKAFQATLRRAIEEDVLTRAAGPSVPVVIMETRRGTQDACGWFAETYGDRVRPIVYRCRAEAGEQDGRAPGDYLWAEKFGAEWHASQPHLTHGGRVWETLYQQRPSATAGTSIRRHWYDETRYTDDPRRLADKAPELVIAVDCASSPDDDADFTVMQAWARTERDYWLLDERRGQWDINAQARELTAFAERWRHPARTIIVENSSNGIALRQMTARTLGTLRVETATKGHADSTAATAKERRAWALIAASEQGRVHVPVGALGDAVIDEWVALGTASPDDRVDAAAHAVARFETPEPRRIYRIAGGLAGA